MPKKLSSLDRKYQSIAQESRLVQKDIRRLTKSLTKPSAPGVYELPGGKRAGAKSRPASSAATTNARMAENRRASTAGREVLHVDATSGERFSSYLVRNLSSKQPLRQTQSVQRNKAIFMLIFVGVVAYVVFKLLAG